MKCKQSAEDTVLATADSRSTSVGFRALFSLSPETHARSLLLYASVFSCLWLEWARLRRCPRSARWASSGSRTPHGSCGASKPCFRRWTAQSEVRARPGSGKPLAHSSPRDKRAPAPQTQPPAAGPWPHRREYGPDRPDGPPYCAGASKPGAETTAAVLTL